MAYTRAQLEDLNIGELRAMGKAAGLTTQKKGGIVAALASDYREGATVAVAVTPTAPASAPLRGSQEAQEPGERIVWAEVPNATCVVNGSYVEPLFYSYLKLWATSGHVALAGPAGSGKTLAVHHLAAAQGKRLAVITADGGFKKRDALGSVQMVAGSTVFETTAFATAARDGHWVLIDEINMAQPDDLAFLNGMLDDSRTMVVGTQTVPVHSDFRCFVTLNPGYGGTKRLNEALDDRFFTLETPPLLGDELAAMLRAHDVPEIYIDDSTYLFDLLYRSWERSRITYQISPRRILDAAKMATLTTGDYREILAMSILPKVGNSHGAHERAAVAEIIVRAWEAKALTSEAA